jgi:hypothetical protein
VIDIVPDKKKRVEEDEVDRLEVAMNKIGERMGSQMKVGNIGAYLRMMTTMIIIFLSVPQYRST